MDLDALPETEPVTTPDRAEEHAESSAPLRLTFRLEAVPDDGGLPTKVSEVRIPLDVRVTMAPEPEPGPDAPEPPAPPSSTPDPGAHEPVVGPEGLYPWVDLREDGLLRSIYSDKGFDVREIISYDRELEAYYHHMALESLAREGLEAAPHQVEEAMFALESQHPYNTR